MGALSQEHFANTAIHLDPLGDEMLVEQIIASGVINSR
jgi:hypothetical protein